MYIDVLFGVYYNLFLSFNGFLYKLHDSMYFKFIYLLWYISIPYVYTLFHTSDRILIGDGLNPIPKVEISFFPLFDLSILSPLVKIYITN